ncbi:alpha/beta hydrolase [Legionella cardiaca]|uniref:Alpha/beta hydrolase n=1 Tax=Legionella cardiaca TaxID=1071983 RepID=A0ABY8ATI7_9GAMM|nr:alpha/beta hydrolase [Legionella cardiaca]WED42457.1 alpha/beta hydrolase [Legionella cardiaca]
MKRIISISLKIFLLLVILLIGILGYLYYRYQSQFTYDIANLENRSGVHLVNKEPAMKAYFATNRIFDLKANPFYTNKMSEQLTYGVTYVPIPKAYRLGGVFDTTRILDLQQFDREKFYKVLKKSVDDSKTKLLVIWVHGYANSFTGSASVLARGAYDLNTEATYLFFSWPSQYKLFSYSIDEETEKKTAPYFAQFLKELRHEIPEAKLIIIGHSLGTRLICDSFDILYHFGGWADSESEIQDVIMIAPDVDEGDFDNEFKKQILAMVNRLTVYVASDDQALLISHLEYGDNPLGLPKEFKSDSHLDETQALLAIMPHENPRFDIIDATYIVKPEFLKHRYYRSRAIISDIYWLLHNSPSHKRQLYRSKLHPSGHYWILPP